MNKKRKRNLGLKKGTDFSWEEREEIIKDYLSSGCSKVEIWKKHTGQNEEHGQLLRWMRVLGYEDNQKKRAIFASSNYIMAKKQAKNTNEQSFEEQQLQKRVAELEQQLKDAEMKAIAFSTMVDIAEKEFNISIRKKYNTRPSKK